VAEEDDFTAQERLRDLAQGFNPGKQQY